MIAVLPSMIHPKQPFSDGLGGQNANTLVTNRMPFDTYNLSAELRISKGVMKGQCLFMSLSQ